MNIKHFIVPFNSKEYKDTIDLRERVLRFPLGMTYTKQQLLDEENQIHIAQYVNGNITACLVMKVISNDVAKMRQVAVEPELQGKGYGSKLVDFTEQEMKKQGFNRIELHGRENSLAFYSKLNYQVEGDVFDEIGIPHFKMTKSID